MIVHARVIGNLQRIHQIQLFIEWLFCLLKNKFHFNGNHMIVHVIYFNQNNGISDDFLLLYNWIVIPFLFTWENGSK